MAGFSRSFSGGWQDVADPFCEPTGDERQDVVIEAINERLPELVALLGRDVRIVNVSVYGHVNVEPGADAVSITIATAPC